jgi:hypothetical protein
MPNRFSNIYNPLINAPRPKRYTKAELAELRREKYGLPHAIDLWLTERANAVRSHLEPFKGQLDMSQVSREQVLCWAQKVVVKASISFFITRSPTILTISLSSSLNPTTYSESPTFTLFTSQFSYARTLAWLPSFARAHESYSIVGLVFHQTQKIQSSRLQIGFCG